MQRLCRNDALTATVAFLDNAVVEPAIPCPDVALFSTTIVRSGDGCRIELSFDVCAAHEGDAWHLEGHQGSRILRQPTGTAVQS